MANCIRSIRAKNYQNLIIAFQITVKDVVNVFWGTASFGGSKKILIMMIYSFIFSGWISQRNPYKTKTNKE